MNTFSLIKYLCCFPDRHCHFFKVSKHSAAFITASIFYSGPKINVSSANYKGSLFPAAKESAFFHLQPVVVHTEIVGDSRKTSTEDTDTETSVSLPIK